MVVETNYKKRGGKGGGKGREKRKKRRKKRGGDCKERIIIC
jgi:hypothetical protein